ncbi:MAG: hypothetical protein ACKOC8_02595 [Pirellulales bacterium]
MKTPPRRRRLIVSLGLFGWLMMGMGPARSRGEDVAAAAVEEEVTIVGDAEGMAVVIEEVADGPRLAVPPPPVPPAAGDGLFGAGLRMLFDAIAPAAAVPPADDADAANERAGDPARQQAVQQREQIRQHARQLEQMLQPALRTELDVIRRSCGDLSPAARRAVLAAGRTALTKAALEVATVQMTGGDRRRAVEPRRRIADALAAALEPLAPAEEFAAYRREQRLRQERREAAARVAIVAKLDRRLDLTAAQRAAIEADLAERWEPAWVRELDDRGMIMNNERPCPDYAVASIEPHLREAQRADWNRWRKAAGSAVIGMHGGWNIDSLGLHVEDEWWTK